VRHEFINGQLRELPGSSDVSNEMAGNIARLLHHSLKKEQGYQLYIIDIKVAIPGRQKFIIQKYSSQTSRRQLTTAT